MVELGFVKEAHRNEKGSGNDDGHTRVQDHDNSDQVVEIIL